MSTNEKNVEILEVVNKDEKKRLIKWFKQCIDCNPPLKSNVLIHLSASFKN